MDNAGAVGPGDGEAARGCELQELLVALRAHGPGLGKAAGQDQQVPDAAIGGFLCRVEDRVRTDDDDGEIDRRIDGGDRSHRVVTEDRAAPGIDRHHASAVTRLAQHLHDGAARGGGALAGADDGNAPGREERREIAFHDSAVAAQVA